MGQLWQTRPVATSEMRRAMAGQADELERLLDDEAGLDAAAERLAGRRVVLAGTGTSFHAAQHGAWFLRLAGIDARAVAAADAAGGPLAPRADEAVVVLHHRGTKRYSSRVVDRARERGAPLVIVSRRGNPDADLETTEGERSSAFTASHLAAMMRCAQLAVRLGAPFDPGRVPDGVRKVLHDPPLGVTPPVRLLQLAGVGANRWTAAEGALKARETSRVAADGLGAEQLLHGPMVALGGDDTLVLLDGGDDPDGRLDDLERLAGAHGCPVRRISERALGPELSVFPLTVAVQRLAAELAEARGIDPERFGRELPAREAAWANIEL